MDNFKILFFFVIISAFVFSCKNIDNENKSEVSNDSTAVSDVADFEIMEFDKEVVGKLSDIQGDFVKGYKWKDKAGLNLLIFTRATDLKSWNDPDCEGCGDQYVYLKAYHFAGTESNYSLVRLVQDANQEGCGDPPFGLESDFVYEAISLTDLDKDGYAEVTFMYYCLCASEFSSIPFKLIMLENGEKYAIRGETGLPGNGVAPEKNIDFGNAPKELTEYANQQWDKYCTLDVLND